MAKRKHVTWKHDVEHLQRELKPARFFPNVELVSDNVDLFAGKLVLGGLFFTNACLAVDIIQASETISPPFPYISKVHHNWSSSRFIALGSIAIYSGEVRVEEIAFKFARDMGTMVRANRHSFIINSQRFLVRDLNRFTPLAID